MKRVIDGIAYNTGTAQKVATGTYHYDKRGEHWVIETTVYRTKSGSFFTVEADKPKHLFGHFDHESSKLTPVSYDDAYALARSKVVDILASGIFPTATADAE